MTRLSGLVFPAILTIAAAFAAPPSQEKPAHRSAASSKHPAISNNSSNSVARHSGVASARIPAKSGPQLRPVSTRSASLGATHGRVVNGRIVRGRHVVARSTASSFQAHPDENRYRQIQQALADKGYFKGEVNGQWSQDSVEALQKFQLDNKLPDIYSDGKVNSLSLIGLGLGPTHGAHAGEAVPTPPMPEPPVPLAPASSSASSLPPPQSN